MLHAVVGSDFSAKICEGLTIEDLDKEAIAEMKTQYARKQENPLFQNYPDELFYAAAEGWKCGDPADAS